MCAVVAGVDLVSNHRELGRNGAVNIARASIAAGRAAPPT
jgi:hypothetical protein